jgi:acetolactate synthase-1/2/3 large subunit
VRQQQELFYSQRYTASRLETRTDLVAVARGFGVRAIRLADPDSTRLRDEIARPGPCLIDFPIAAGANVLPMVPPGAANRDAIGSPGG